MKEGASGRVGYMNYGTLSRIWCPKCKEETIHTHGGCCRTGCTHQVEHFPVRVPAMSGGRALVPPKLRRAIVSFMRLTKTPSFGYVAEKYGVSPSFVKKLAKEYGITRR